MSEHEIFADLYALINLVLRVLSSNIRAKFRLKSRLITAQCVYENVKQISSFTFVF